MLYKHALNEAYRCFRGIVLKTLGVLLFTCLWVFCDIWRNWLGFWSGWEFFIGFQFKMWFGLLLSKRFLSQHVFRSRLIFDKIRWNYLFISLFISRTVTVLDKMKQSGACTYLYKHCMVVTTNADQFKWIKVATYNPSGIIFNMMVFCFWRGYTLFSKWC
jgi:hypothetical protein